MGSSHEGAGRGMLSTEGGRETDPSDTAETTEPGAQSHTVMTISEGGRSQAGTFVVLPA